VISDLASLGTAELLRNRRKTDSRPGLACSSLIWHGAFAAFALLRNSRKTDSLPAAKSAEFLFRLMSPEAAFALLRNSRKTDSLPAAKSAEFLFRLMPPGSGLCAFEELAQNGLASGG